MLQNLITPGPWTLMDEHLQSEGTGDENPMIIGWNEQAEESVTIAIASSDASELYANARAIARVPAMLAIIQDFVYAHEPNYVSAMADEAERTPYDEIADAAHLLLSEI